MGLDPWEQQVLKKWKTMRLVYAYLDKELGRIQQRCFPKDLETPQVMVRRMKFSRSQHGGHLGADYRPPINGRPARIGILPFLLLDKKDVRIALAHELIHHWEFMGEFTGELMGEFMTHGTLCSKLYNI